MTRKILHSVLCASSVWTAGQSALASSKSDAASLSPTKKPLLVEDFAGVNAADSNSEYFKILGQIEQIDASGQRSLLTSPNYFQGLTWIGKTACINYVCGIFTLDKCRKIIELGLNDEALVVRDHALRITISTKHFDSNEKRAAAERILNDNRNYRKGRPFWIVDRARAFLSVEVLPSAAR